MRLYSFTNYYLSNLQQGLQTTHAVVEMFRKYQLPSLYYPSEHYSDMNTQLNDWATNHKTLIYLNGGNHKNLYDMVMNFTTRDNKYPWAVFREDEQSLNECITCVAIVVPTHIYELASCLRLNGVVSPLDVNKQLDAIELGGNEWSNKTYPEVTQIIQSHNQTLSQFDKELIMLINTCPLAK